MEVAIAGGHGRIGLLLGKLLRESEDAPWGLIRDPAQEDDLHAAGIEPVLCDIEGDGDAAAAIKGADAVVFAAGAGPGSGAERKWTVDYGGAVKLIEAAKAEGVRRYVMVSSIGAGDPPPEGGDVFGEYLRAKAKADQALMASALDFTIVRPASLSDDPAAGLVTLGENFGRGEIPRADVAAVLAAVLHHDNTIGKTFELIGGETPVAEAVASL
jgi:nucleoside-diphosphate-sugar epimerase